MKAVVLSPGSTTLRLTDVPEPRVSTAEEVKVRVLRVGICGTDREEALGLPRSSYRVVQPAKPRSESVGLPAASKYESFVT